jgi:cytochrome c-type biogenesis protein
MGVMLIVFAILIATNTLSYIADFLIKTMPSITSLG